MTAAIEIRELRKVFRVRERAVGWRGTLRQLVAPRSRDVVALDGADFRIEAGERVAFIGPNGAGKSTTLKILCGILHPSSGDARVLGRVPWQERRELCYSIAAVFGQRSQLWYHLPAADTFALLARVYDQDASAHRRRLDALVEAFRIGDLIGTPVRQLSLGERMRCELVASLLHAPQIVLLDEPTIGLDVTAKAVIRDLVREQSLREGRTVLLTSHDTGDMERVCERVIVIHRGRVLVDEPVEALRRSIRRKRITLRTSEERVDVELAGVRTLSRRPHLTELEVDLERTPVEAVVQAALRAASLQDITVEDPPMEEIVKNLYAGADAALAS